MAIGRIREGGSGLLVSSEEGRKGERVESVVEADPFFCLSDRIYRSRQHRSNYETYPLEARLPRLQDDERPEVRRVLLFSSSPRPALSLTVAFGLSPSLQNDRALRYYCQLSRHSTCFGRSQGQCSLAFWPRHETKRVADRPPSDHNRNASPR